MPPRPLSAPAFPVTERKLPSRENSPETELARWQARTLEMLAATSKRGSPLPPPRYLFQREEVDDAKSTAESEQESDSHPAVNVDAIANPMDAKRRAGLKRLSQKTQVLLPDVQEVITRLRSGNLGFCKQELDKINQAFLRFKDDDAPEVHKDMLPTILNHLGYAQVDHVKVREMADTITTYPVLEKSDFINFMEQHSSYEYEIYRNIFETFDEDNSGSLDSQELVPFLSTLGITPLRSVVKEAIEMVDIDGNGTLDFEETVILIHVYKHSEGFTMNEINDLVNVYRLEHEEHLAASDLPLAHNKHVSLPAEKLSSLLVKYFGPSAAVMSAELQQEIKGVGRKGDGSAEMPIELNFQEALIWARKLRDKEFESYREAFSKFDIDCSKTIDRHELGLAIKTLGFTLKNYAIEEMITEAITRGEWGSIPEGGIEAIQELDYDNFVHFMRILQETDGFTKKEMTQITATFNKFDDDGSGDIDVIELGDMLRHLGHAAAMDEVRRLHAMVDLTGSGALDFREFIHFLRLYREDEIKHIKDIFDDFSEGYLEDAVIKADAMEEAVQFLLSKHERLEGLTPLEPESFYRKGEDVGLDEFTEIADTIREAMVGDSRKAAGYSSQDVSRYKQTWEAFNTKKVESLKLGEAAQLLMQMGFELRSMQEQQMLKEQIDKACRAALEAHAEGVIMGQVNFWVFLQLLRALNRREDEDSERRLMEAAAVSRFSTQEVNEFNEVFDSCWEREQVQAEEQSDAMQVVQSCRKTISRGGLMKLLRSMGMRLEGPHRTALDNKLQSMMASPPEDGSVAKLAVDFPAFLRLMRWMMESDFGGIMTCAEKQGKGK
eukprot:TRINITY_DN32047_c0_g1_i1.p1 TRINITY_DN32047_c0_g1~~TRINITY_DN32047_c0_g1_i1.p1  ORF type:complete len:836 (-),score=226.63 TRINITY_DN32047_c0_g1_i1:35-2542(-)